MAVGFGNGLTTTSLFLFVSLPLASGLAKPKTTNDRDATGADTNMNRTQLIAYPPYHAVSLLGSRATNVARTASRCICDYTVGGRKRKHRKKNCVCRGARTSRGEEDNRDFPYPEQMDIPAEDGEEESIEPPHAAEMPNDYSGYYQNDGWLPPRERGPHYTGPLGVVRPLQSAPQNIPPNYPRPRHMTQPHWQQPPQWRSPQPNSGQVYPSPPQEQLPPEPLNEQMPPELTNDPLFPMLADEEFPIPPQFLPSNKKSSIAFGKPTVNKYSREIRIPIDSEELSPTESYRIGKPVEHNKQMWVPLIPFQNDMTPKNHMRSPYVINADEGEPSRRHAYRQEDERSPYPRPQPPPQDPYMNPYAQSANFLPPQLYPYPPPHYMSRAYETAPPPYSDRFGP